MQKASSTSTIPRGQPAGGRDAPTRNVPATAATAQSSLRTSRGIAENPQSAAFVASRREDFAGVQEAARVEDAFQVLLERDEIGRLLERQVLRLRDADAVLARQRAAERDGFAHERVDRGVDRRALGVVVP